MDLSSSSADWISQFVTEDYGHGWAQLEMPSFNSVMESSDGDCKEHVAKQAKRDSTASWSSSAVISFGSSPSFRHHNQELPLYKIKPKLEAPVSGDELGLFAGSGDSGKRRAGSGTPASACGREHVIAERKRREKLTQRFILLSSLLPGLKKLDKASVLGEAARYLKQLQEQVKVLEEQTSQTAVESSVVTNSKKHKTLSTQHDLNPSSSSSSNDNFDSSSSEDPLPEIQARFSDKDVLINVQCQSKQGLVPRILEEIQKLHLSIVNCNAMPFAKCTMVVTVVAKMNDEFSATTVELVSMIRQNLQTLM